MGAACCGPSGSVSPEGAEGGSGSDGGGNGTMNGLAMNGNGKAEAALLAAAAPSIPIPSESINPNYVRIPDNNIHEEPALDRSINQYLNKESKKFKDEHKLLLLGAGESGKSTIFKQMHILHSKDAKGFSVEERMRVHRSVIYQNLFEGLQVLIQAAQRNELAFGSEDNAGRCKRILAVTPNQAKQAPSMYIYNDMKALWQGTSKNPKSWPADPGLKAVVDMFNSSAIKDFRLANSALYFINAMDRIGGDDSYVPTDEDILRARLPTTGVHAAHFFSEQHHLNFQLVDVGGQRGARTKWASCFDGVDAVIFVASLVDYDQVLEEDPSVNRMQESLDLFADVCALPVFQNTTILLFLNKKDLFQKKVEADNFGLYFPKYTHGKDYNAALRYINKMYMARTNKRHKVYFHVTCATDTNDIEFVWTALMDQVLNESLKQSGI